MEQIQKLQFLTQRSRYVADPSANDLPEHRITLRAEDEEHPALRVTTNHFRRALPQRTPSAYATWRRAPPARYEPGGRCSAPPSFEIKLALWNPLLQYSARAHARRRVRTFTRLSVAANRSLSSENSNFPFFPFFQKFWKNDQILHRSELGLQAIDLDETLHVPPSYLTI